MFAKAVLTIALLAIASILLISGVSTGAAPHADYPYVSKVVDGDTIEVNDGHDTFPVRLIGIDTPETYPSTQCGGTQATAFMTDLVQGKTISLEYDVERKDAYDRTLAYVYLDGQMVNEAIAQAGWARYFTFPPNTKHEQQFVDEVHQAIDDDKGLWAACPDAMGWATS